MKKLFTSLTFTFLFFIMQSHAALLMVQNSISLSQSSSLWIADDKNNYQQQGSNKIATRGYYQMNLDVTFWKNDDFDISAGLSRAYVKLNDGSFFGATENQSNNNFSEFSVGANYRLFNLQNHSFFAGAKYIHPGNTKVESPTFLSFNDFSQYLDLSITSASQWSSVTWENQLRLRAKVDGPGNNHYAFESSILYAFNDQVRFGGALIFLALLEGLISIAKVLMIILLKVGNIRYGTKKSNGLV